MASPFPIAENARDRLLYALNEIASQEPARLQAAEELLREWSTETGYFSTLQDIFLNKSLDQNVRWQAIIQLKNGIGRYWRRSANNAIQREEKSIIRNRLFENMDEELSTLAVQNAVIVAKIARCDFPMEWDTLLQTLLSIIQSASTLTDMTQSRLIKQRALYTLHLVVKSLCSKTLTASRKAFQEISPELFYHVGQIYHSHMEQWMSSIKQQQSYSEMANDMQISLVALKCLRRLIAHGFEDFTKQETPLANELMGLSESTEAVLIGKHATLVGKFYIDAQYYRPIPFVLAPKSMVIIHNYWNIIATKGQQHNLGQPIESQVVERCLIQGMTLLRALIKNVLYTPQKGAKTFQETLDARNILDQQLLTPEFASTCVETIVGRFLPLSSVDIAAWEDDSEVWLIEEAADAYEYKLRKCSEKLFMDMMSEYRDRLAPFVISMLESVSDRSDPEGLLLKDAVYCAAGLSAHELYEVLNFDDWLQHRLYVELEQSDRSQPLIRQRIAWLIGQWISVKVSKASRPAIYQLIYLRVDDWEFEATDFSPYLENTVTMLAHILRDSSEAETRMRILNCMSVIVERMEHEIAPFAIQIAQLLPPLWDVGEEEHMFRASILVTVNKLIGALKTDSVALHGLVAPLVRMCVNPTTPEFVYLGEDGLELWWITVQNTPQLTNELVELLPAAIALLEYGSDSFITALRIVESYTLIDAEYLLTHHGEALFGLLANLVDGVRVRATRGILQLIERISEKTSITLYGPIMMSSNLLLTMIRVAIETKEQFNILAHYFVVLARIILADKTAFLQVLRDAAGSFNVDATRILGVFLNIWFERFDNLGHPKHRKLCAMALTELFISGDPIVLHYYTQFANIWTEVLYEIRAEDGTDDLIQVSDEPDMEEDAYQMQPISADTAEEKRRRALLSTDPVHTVELKKQVQNALSICDSVLGMPGALQQAQADLDTDLAIQLNDRLTR
ncbi:armadillo-type protein [Syncephalis fuscata]|nr:armadillo-type protein [Syncephalis fuscata]